jgi:hypothetical protein
LNSEAHTKKPRALSKAGLSVTGAGGHAGGEVLASGL